MKRIKLQPTTRNRIRHPRSACNARRRGPEKERIQRYKSGLNNSQQISIQTGFLFPEQKINKNITKKL